MTDETGWSKDRSVQEVKFLKALKKSQLARNTLCNSIYNDNIDN